jgi:predicted RecB family nuclease
MTLKEMTRHNSKGIFSVKQLSYTFRPRRPTKRQKQQFHHNFALQALALRENKVHVHGTPILTLPPTRVYLDIEGLPDRGFYYLIGVLVVKGQSHQYHSFWADDENSQVRIFEQLASLFTGTGIAPGNVEIGGAALLALSR